LQDSGGMFSSRREIALLSETGRDRDRFVRHPERIVSAEFFSQIVGCSTALRSAIKIKEEAHLGPETNPWVASGIEGYLLKGGFFGKGLLGDALLSQNKMIARNISNYILRLSRLISL
jgi:hypothetical protein